MNAKMILVALAMTLTIVYADEASPVNGRARFLAVTSTQTRLTFSTVTGTSTVARTCAVLVNITGPCRRRRGMEEKPVILSFDEDLSEEKLFPSKPITVVATVAPALVKQQSEASPVVESSSEQLTEIDVIGLDDSCRRGRIGLGLTVLFTTIQTAVFSTFSFVTSGTVPFFVGGCTPSPFVYSTC